MWNPTQIKYSIKVLHTSTNVVRVMTDDGIGYLKVMGNPEGPHALIREYIGTSVAKFLGLKTLEFAIIEITNDDKMELANGNCAQSGPAFITKEVLNPIVGSKVPLKKVVNRDHFCGLIIADTLLMNRDRYPGLNNKPNFDNLLFSNVRKNEYELIAMDFSHCMHASQSINRSLKSIDIIKNDELYGFFPEFRSYIDKSSFEPFHEKLKLLDENCIITILASVPAEWELNSTIKEIIITFLVQRSKFLYEHIEQLIAHEDGKLFLM